MVVVNDYLRVIVKIRKFVFVVVFWDFADIMRGFEVNLEVLNAQTTMLDCRVLLHVFIFASLGLF